MYAVDCCECLRLIVLFFSVYDVTFVDLICAVLLVTFGVFVVLVLLFVKGIAGWWYFGWCLVVYFVVL